MVLEVGDKEQSTAVLDKLLFVCRSVCWYCHANERNQLIHVDC